jgi:hypothetical protein
MCKFLKKRGTWIAALGLAVLLAASGSATPVQAADHAIRLHRHSSHGHFHGGGRHWHGHGGHGHRWSGSFYHRPSVHFDALWHHEYDHWSPRRGWHSHGHYDSVPHYVPGHFDYHHFDHIVPHPFFHH